MSKQVEAIKLALEALKNCRENIFLKDYVEHIDLTITALRQALAEQPAQQEPVAKPYAYEYGRDNGDGTYSVVIEKGDLVQTAPAVYNYVRPRNAHKDWPIKELFDRPQPPPQRTWVGLTDEEIIIMSRYDLEYATLIGEVQKKLKEKNT